MKTILQALTDEIHYPAGKGFMENRLLKRGLNGDDECTPETMNGRAFMGAVADCLYSLIEAPNFSEADKSFSFSDRDLILKKANSIYNAIGETDNIVGVPTVVVGDCLIP